jgi:hypothetical protein
MARSSPAYARVHTHTHTHTHKHARTHAFFGFGVAFCPFITSLNTHTHTHTHTHTRTRTHTHTHTGCGVTYGPFITCLSVVQSSLNSVPIENTRSDSQSHLTPWGWAFYIKRNTSVTVKRNTSVHFCSLCFINAEANLN